jgi:hypothetical protein
MALGVKREWKKPNGGGKDYPGHPETAHMHETHDVIQNHCQLNGIHILCRHRRTSEAKIVARRNRFVSSRFV